MHGRLIEKISWSTCGRHVTLWHRSAFENRIVTTNSSMIKRPFLSAFGYHSDKIGRYSFTLRGRLRFKVAGGYARSHRRGRAWILNILKVTCSFFSPPLVCIWQQMLTATQSCCVQSVGVFASEICHRAALQTRALYFTGEMITRAFCIDEWIRTCLTG